MLSKLDFFPGNFSTQYGRAMGGIVDVGIKDPQTEKKLKGMVQADLIDARVMAEGLASVPGIKIDSKKSPTNILVFDISGTGMETAEFSRRLATKNILAAGIDNELMRFATHHDVSRDDCLETLEAVRHICK